MNRKLLGIFSPDMPAEDVADAIRQALDEVLEAERSSDDPEGADTDTAPGDATSPPSEPPEAGA